MVLLSVVTQHSLTRIFIVRIAENGLDAKDEGLQRLENQR
jgi:hypothetical protein